MSLCLYTGEQCECQPQDGTPCPNIPRFDIELGGYGRDSIAHICKPDGEWVRYTDEPEQDAILAKFAAAGFKYDGNGSWRADLTTDELLTLAAGMEGKVK